MNPIFINTIVFVKDLERSKAFYSDVLGQKAVKDFGTIVFYENHLVLHAVGSIIQTVFQEDWDETAADQGQRNLLIYFETDELEDMFARVSASGAQIIHGIKQQEWGQAVFRFLDPDGHIVEIGELFELKSQPEV